MVTKRLLCLIAGHRFNHKLGPDGTVSVTCNQCGKAIDPADMRKR